LISDIQSTIVAGAHNAQLPKILQNNGIMIGTKCANELGLEIGQAIDLLYTHETQAKTISLEKREAEITAIFHTGIEELDANLVICSLDFFHDFFPHTGINELGITLKKGANQTHVINKLHNRTKLSVNAWTDLYPALVAALKLEKYAMFFILALITLVASMSMISLLFMQITQKRGDIAILKAHGLPAHYIQRIFLLMGMGIAFCATIIGLALAFVVGWLLQTYPFIKLPDVYYTSHLPIEMEPGIFALVFIIVMILSFIATIIPIRSMRTINIAHVLRYEA
jgi:lipoprotein-releasing system permease protein